MSRERARRREEREQVVAAAAAARAAETQRQARRTARWQRLTGWIPRPRPLPPGRLAQRRRSEVRATIALLVAFNILVWVFVPSWAGRALALAVCLLGAPVLHLMLHKRGA